MESTQEMNSNNNIEEHLNNLSNENQILEPIAHDVNGTVKWFNRIKGYGFITRDETKEDIFVHFSGIKQENSKTGSNSNINISKKSKRRLNLFDQERVVFDIVKNGNLLEAKNVTGRNGYFLIDQIAFKRGISPLNTQIANDNRLTGKVKWFNVKTRYGYIQCDFNNEDVYVNSTSIIKNNPEKYKASLADGELVEFDILKIGPNGRLEAVNVTGPNGDSVKGSDYAPDKVDKSKQNCIEQTIQGKVKWFNLKSGFGYITRNDNGQDIYVHYTSVSNKNPNHRLRSLGDGELVTFNVIDSSKGLEAVDVTGPEGAPVLGSQYARPIGGRRGRGDNNEDNEDDDDRSPRTRERRGGQRGGSRVGGGGRGGRISGGGLMSGGPSGDSPRRRPRNPRSTSGPRRNGPNDRMMNNNNNMGRPPRRGGRGGGPQMNIRNNYAPNPYNTNNFYDNNEPLYYAFKPKNKLPYETDGPRRIPFDRYINMVNRPNNNNNINNNNIQRNGNSRPPRNQVMSQSNSNNTSLIMVAERVPGYCKWFNYVRGFGYIIRFDNRQEIYVHRTALQQAQQNGSLASLDEGEPVEFDVCQDPMNNVMAVNVTGPNRTMLKGSRYAAISSTKQERSPLQTKVYRRRRMAN